jgi:hypothetical protein
VGAQLWHHEAPGGLEPAEALKALQARFLAEMNYDLTAMLPQELSGARESVAAARAEGDPYGLVDEYEERVRLLEGLCNRPIPNDPEGRVKILRQICAYTGQGISNVLDVKGCSDKRGVHIAQRLNEQETVRLVGTSRPTIAQARQAIGKINEDLGRGESVCFPIYDNASNGKAVGWYFVGNTID